MPLIQLVVTLIVVGVLLWAMNTYIPMDPKIRQIINLVVVVAVVIWLLRVFGVLDYAKGIRVGAWQTRPLGGVCTVLGESGASVSSNCSGADLLWKPGVSHQLSSVEEVGARGLSTDLRPA
jgi:hypothetical protein